MSAEVKTCKTCRHFKKIEGCYGKKYCFHPASETDDPYTFFALEMNDDDYCSRHEEGADR